MKTLMALFWPLMLFPSLVFAGLIWGTIRVEHSTASGQKTQVKITCSGKTYTTMAQIPGSYRLTVPEAGKCQLTLPYKKQSLSYSIRSRKYKDMRYDFLLKPTGDGGYQLLRE